MWGRPEARTSLPYKWAIVNPRTDTTAPLRLLEVLEVHCSPMELQFSPPSHRT